MIRRQHVVRDFFAEAEAMRDSLEACFKDAYTHKVSWQYFCAPGLYTYLRTEPRVVIPQPILTRFTRYLREWCLENLGLVPTHDPSLNLMINGCKLELHSDFHNGTWGYVYSLTRWQDRKFSGGETLLMRDGVPSYKRHHVHGEVLYELIPARFNQLLVFDDRIVHGTPIIEGNMDPMDGRIAIVGHLRATSPLVEGPLPDVAARAVVLGVLPVLAEQVKKYKDVQGTVTYRLTVSATGAVESVTLLTDNVVTPLSGYNPSEEVNSVKSLIQQTMAQLQFPDAVGKSSVIVPVLIPIPDLRPVEIVIPHDLERETARKRAATFLEDGDVSGLQGNWDSGMFVAREPIAGSIRIEPQRIVASFDPPMWVPSQRDQFQATLTRQLTASLTRAMH